MGDTAGDMRLQTIEARSNLVTRRQVGLTAGQASAPFFLKRSGDIQLIKKNGRRVSTGLFNLQICPGTMPQDTMMGIVIGRRFGTAVRRNRAKRLFRELGRAVRPTLSAGTLSCFPKRQCLNVPFVELQSVWRSTFAKTAVGSFWGALVVRYFCIGLLSVTGPVCRRCLVPHAASIRPVPSMRRTPLNDMDC